MTRILHRAERAIKEAVNAGPEGQIVSVGFGSTAAINHLQRIVGTALPPATREMFFSLVREHAGAERAADLERFIEARRPVVFIGPYEHHSNELTWREGLCTVVVVRLGRDGGIDLAHLEELLRDPRYSAGCASARSRRPPMSRAAVAHAELAAMLHRHGAMACFDYAASAPYVRIDMNPPPGPAGEDARLDAVFISPHKFLGGPGSSGILVFNERIYRKDLAPSTAAGGPSPTSAGGAMISSTMSRSGRRPGRPASFRRSRPR